MKIATKPLNNLPIGFGFENENAIFAVRINTYATTIKNSII